VTGAPVLRLTFYWRFLFDVRFDVRLEFLFHVLRFMFWVSWVLVFLVGCCCCLSCLLLLAYGHYCFLLLEVVLCLLFFLLLSERATLSLLPS
jgi:hypothetical protein